MFVKFLKPVREDVATIKGLFLHDFRCVTRIFVMIMSIQSVCYHVTLLPALTPAGLSIDNHG